MVGRHSAAPPVRVAARRPLVLMRTPCCLSAAAAILIAALMVGNPFLDARRPSTSAGSPQPPAVSPAGNSPTGRTPSPILAAMPWWGQPATTFSPVRAVRRRAPLPMATPAIDLGTISTDAQHAFAASQVELLPLPARN